jgi:hypothetical protein
MKIFDEMKDDFDLFQNNREEYNKKIDKLNQLFNLTNEKELKKDMLPLYYSGSINDNNPKIIILCLNPGWNKDNCDREQEFKEGSFEKMQDSSNNYFEKFKKKKMRAAYYEKLSKIFGAFDNLQLSDYEEKFDYCHKYVFNIDLIPYYSQKFGLPNILNNNKKNPERKKYLEKRFQNNLEFIKHISETHEIKFILIHGKPNNDIINLLYPEIYQNLDWYDIENMKISSFSMPEINSIKIVIFNYFLSERFGLTDEHYKKIIPEKIKELLKNS